MKYAKVAAVAASTLMMMGAAAPAFADAGTKGGVKKAGGFGSANVVQIPFNIPINACGNTIQFIGLLNPAFGNRCKIH
ncbi:putative chaplin protein [Streptomyces sp. NBRC 110611]|uniref:chaplin n=1 Tax=Streptomyces sp. NBRC 110611 TaxID=1621259 RepID=UPI00082D15EB|nr:chaplin [Streptomyces sp. NBRC 110611]GAU68808.1 putative chaplin protein [Streptomyces sp. NBRC 110611]